jgi:opine dehydrogenase
VSLPLLASRVLAAALPADAGDGTLAQLRGLWPCVDPAADVLSVAMSNPNPIVHPPGSLLNVGWIQHAGPDFHMYDTGITEAVARVVHGVYREVEAVAEALGTRVLRYEEEAFRTRASIMGVAFRAPFDTVAVIGSIAGPGSVEDRYITEDLPYGLVPVAELGDAAGVETPLIDAIVTLGSAVCGRDFRSEGRGIERLGLAGLAPDEIVERVRHGRAPTEAG